MPSLGFGLLGFFPLLQSVPSSFSCCFCSFTLSTNLRSFNHVTPSALMHFFHTCSFVLFHKECLSSSEHSHNLLPGNVEVPIPPSAHIEKHASNKYMLIANSPPSEKINSIHHWSRNCSLLEATV